MMRVQMLGLRDKPDLTIPAFVDAWEKAGLQQGETVTHPVIGKAMIAIAPIQRLIRRSSDQQEL